MSTLGGAVESSAARHQVEYVSPRALRRTSASHTRTGQDSTGPHCQVAIRFARHLSDLDRRSVERLPGVLYALARVRYW